MSNGNVQLGEVELTIVGDDNVKVVIATLGDYLAIGTARRDPADKPDALIGESLAAGRAIRQLGRQILSATNKEIRHAAYAAECQREAQAEARHDKAWAEYWKDNPRPVTVIEGPPAPPSEQLEQVKPVILEADPEIERLLAEEEAILRNKGYAFEVTEPSGEDDDLPVQGFSDIGEFFAFLDELSESDFED